MLRLLLPLVAALVLGVSPVRPWIVGANPGEPVGSSVSDGITGRVVDPVTGAGLFNPDLDEATVGQDADGVDYPRGTDIGLSRPVLYGLSTRLDNGDFSAPPLDPAASIISDPDDAGYNPLPAWRLIRANDNDVRALWDASGSQVTGGYVYLDVPVVTTLGAEWVLEEWAVITQSSAGSFSYRIAASPFASSGQTLELRGQFFEGDGATAVGSEVTVSGDGTVNPEISVDMGVPGTLSALIRLRLVWPAGLVLNPSTIAGWKEARVAEIPRELRFSGAKTYRTATQSIPDSADTTVTFPAASATEEYDTDGYHSDSSNTGRMTIPADGYYGAKGAVEWAIDTAGVRRLQLIHVAAAGGAETELDQDHITDPSPSTQEYSDVYAEGYWLAGDYLILRAYQTSGGALNINGNGQKTHFSIRRLPGGSPSSPTGSGGGGALTDHTHAVTGSGATGGGGTLTPALLRLPTSAAPTPTVDGELWYDTTIDRPVVGDGSATRTIGTLSSTVSSTQAFGDAATAGTSDSAARRDHVHGMPASPINVGTATVDFGAFPGGFEASVDVTGQAGILAGSVVIVQVRPEATSDHSADEHWLEPLRVFATDIVPGTGFTIRARLDTESIDRGPNDLQRHQSASVVGRLGGGSGAGRSVPGYGTDNAGTAPRLYGTFTVAWMWA